jgi:hypothetical protein
MRDQNKEFITVCAWCQRIKENGEFVAKPIDQHADLTHGICLDCKRTHFGTLK